MPIANSETITLGVIRDKLASLINRRAKAYEASIRKGHIIPHYAEKIRAIKALRAQLMASDGWELQSNLRWIHAMKGDLLLILPAEFHSDEKQKRYRKHMLDLIGFCEDLLNCKPLFSTINPTFMLFKKTVRVKGTVFADRFGCSEKYFAQHIKDHDLVVIWETGEFVGVKDGNAEEWSVPKTQLITVSNTPASGRAISGRGVVS